MRNSIVSTLKSPLLLSMLLGSVVAVGGVALLARLWPQAEVSTPTSISTASSRVLPLIHQVPTVDEARVETLAQQGTALEQQQARYWLGVQALQREEAQRSLDWLQGLEKQKGALTPYILVRQGQALQQLKQTEAASEVWTTLINDYADSPTAAEAYFWLGKTSPQYWDEAIARFPKHPRTIEIARQRLKTDPDNLELLRLIAQGGFHLSDYRTYLDRLTKAFGPQLTPADWQDIAFGYWEKQQYKEGALAYSRAPVTPETAYRTGRGLQLTDQKEGAIAAFQRMVQQFPQAEETALAYIRLAELTRNDNQAAAYLDQAIATAQQQPERSATALAQKANRLPQQRQQLEEKLLQDYSRTEAAADLRWVKAWDAAKGNQWSTALDWSQQIAKQNPDSDQAPKALFWSAKWAERLGQTEPRLTAFNQLWQKYPDSYYAWRAASLSGQPVGTFETLRQQSPRIQVQPQPPLALPVGSAGLQELYALGDDQLAWETWQVEFQNRAQPSPNEQLTDGLIRLQVGEYLDGIFMLANLRDRAQEDPAQQDWFQTLKNNPSYQQALYPLPYLDLVQATRRSNPLLAIALMRQESRFQPKIRSVVGATGLMQLMPETAAGVAQELDLETYNLESPADNIRLGIHYLDSVHQSYQNHTMLAIASYNAGPGNVDQWLQTLPSDDADFFVESIPFPETRNYVKSVLGNYWNYLRIYSLDASVPLAARR